MTANTTAEIGTPAPAVSIDSEEFSHMLAQAAIFWMADPLRYALAREKLVAHIDAKLAQALKDGYEKGANDVQAISETIINRTVGRAKRAEAASQQAAELNGKAQAIKAAVAAIYFDDSSDFGTALWEVVKALDPAMAELLEENPSAAYHQSSAANHQDNDGEKA